MSVDDILCVIRESEFPAVTARWVADMVGKETRPAGRSIGLGCSQGRPVGRNSTHESSRQHGRDVGGHPRHGGRYDSITLVAVHEST